MSHKESLNRDYLEFEKWYRDGWPDSANILSKNEHSQS